MKVRHTYFLVHPSGTVKGKWLWGLWREREDGHREILATGAGFADDETTAFEQALQFQQVVGEAPIYTITTDE